MRYSESMTTQTNAVPTITAVLESLEKLVSAHPMRTTPGFKYTKQGKPYDLTAHILADLGMDLACFEGVRPMNGRATPWNEVRLTIAWDVIFPDSSALFLGMSRDRKIAEDFLVYSLLAALQQANDLPTRNSEWKASTLRALKQFMRMVVDDRVSGFLVQTNGNHSDLAYETAGRVAGVIRNLA